MLDTDIAIPLGLILNELLTNSLKYAFPPNTIDKGNINVSLLRNDNGYTLRVADDGIGFPENIDLSEYRFIGFTVNNHTNKSDRW